MTAAILPLPYSAKDERRLTIERLIAEACTVLANCDVPISRSKVSRIVRAYARYQYAMPFSMFLVARIFVPDRERAEQIESELHYWLDYADPTGEQATRRVLRQRGY